MDCEHALTLISSRLDREINATDETWLSEHLHGCGACRATAEAFAVQHTELCTTFEPRRAAALVTADRVSAAVAGERSNRRRSPVRSNWLIGIAVAIPVGIAAVLFFTIVLYKFRMTNLNPPVANVSPAPPTSAALQNNKDRLTPRPLPKALALKPLTDGQTVTTAAGERLRAALPNGSTVCLNENTSFTLHTANSASLQNGTAYFELAPHQEQANLFLVLTPNRFVYADGAKFAVQQEAKGTQVLDVAGSVTTGDVQAQGLPLNAGTVLHSGEVLAAGSTAASPSQRLSYALDWTRDLVAASESPLVPSSSYEGGALIAVDANGQEAKLSLRKYHVDVHLEDGFARTTIDQTYFNHHPWRLEGTFYFPLPPDASLSRLAMYVDGELNEGGMVERDYGRSVYERVVNSQRDPALLEWVDGSTFKMRVFPLEGRQEKRIILSYTQRVPTLYGRSQYRFPAGHNLQTVRDWSFHALAKNGANYVATSATHPALKQTVQGEDLVLTDAAQDCKVDRDVVLELTDPSYVAAEKDAVRFSEAELDGNEYLMMRYRPLLAAQGVRAPRHWLFLYESSADRDPLLARTQIEIIRTMLQQAESGDRFSLLAASNRIQTLQRSSTTPINLTPSRFVPPTPDQVGGALQELEQTHLVGALDLGTAFRKIGEMTKDVENVYLIHVGGGYTSMGTPQDDLLKFVPPQAKYIGIGVGKHWNRAFMKQCAEKSGGYYTQINPDETIAWRAFELMATLNTPRLLDVKVTAPGAKDLRLLLDNNALAQGEELCAVTRLAERDGSNGTRKLAASKQLTITGLLDGRKFERTVSVENSVPKAGYIPRTWAKLEIDRLLAEDAHKHKDAIIELSKAMYVMTPFTSLLVLENEAMYAQYKVDRGRKDHWALYSCADKIPVVYEPDPTMPADMRNAPKGMKPAASQVMQTIRYRSPARWLVSTEQRERMEHENLKMQREAGFLTTFNDSDSLGLAEPLGEARKQNWNFGTAQDSTWDAPIAFPSPARISKPFSPDGATALSFQMEASHEFGFDGINPAGTLTPAPEPQMRRGTDRAIRMGKTFFKSPVHPINQEYGIVRLSSATENSIQLGRLGADYPLAKPPYGDIGSSELDDANGILLSGTIIMPANNRRRTDLVSDNFALPSLHSAASDDFQHVDSHDQTDFLYHRLRYSGDQRLFTDLLNFAAGLNTSEADKQAVLEAEALPELRQTPGRIDPDARKLIEASRKDGWRKLTLPSDKRQPEPVIVFDGAGRYFYEHKPALGLQEIVSCDGVTLLHQYPEIGLAGRRTVTRFHRAELRALLPWLVPPAEDLAHGVDLECVNSNTVALVPHWVRDAQKEKQETLKYVRLQLVFEKNRLAERQLVELPANKIVSREIYDGKGGVRLLDGDGKELGKRSLQLSDADAPNLTPDLLALVVLPLPLRSRAHVMEELALIPSQPLAADPNACFEYLEAEPAEKLLTALMAEQNAADAQLLYRRCFQERGDQRRGFFTLLAAAGVEVSREPGFQAAYEAAPDDELLHYLAVSGNWWYRYVQRRLPVFRGQSAEQGGSLLRELADVQAQLLRWDSPYRQRLRWEELPQDVQRGDEFLKRHRRDVLGLALLYNMQDRTEGKTKADEVKRNLALAEQWRLVAADTDDAYRARYEQASCLAEANQRAEAEKVFQALFARSLKAGALPLLDERFKNALQSLEKKPFVDDWNPLIRQTAKQFIKDQHYGAVLSLAGQCRQLHEPALADTLIADLLAAVEVQPDGWRIKLAVVHYWMQVDDLVRAQDLLRELLPTGAPASEAITKLGQSPALWRLSAQLAERRGQDPLALTSLEKALELEYQHLPDVIDLQTWRRDYGKLLEQYAKLAAHPHEAPIDLLPRTIRAIDRWRAHDPEAGEACKKAAAIFALLHEEQLAWDYTTTSLIANGFDVQQWRSTAKNLTNESDYALADLALRVAEDVEPKNAEVVWERAKLARQAHHDEEAERLMRRLANEDWPARYQGIRSHAQYHFK